MNGLSYKDRERLRGIEEYLSSVSPGFIILAKRFGFAIEEDADTAYLDINDATIVIPKKWWEPKIGKPSVKELGALIMHEALHGVLGHWIPLLERRVKRVIWNIAADAEVNQVLEEFHMLEYLERFAKEKLKVGEPVTKEFLREEWGVPVEDEDAAETIYAKLLKHVKVVKTPIILDLKEGQCEESNKECKNPNACSVAARGRRSGKREGRRYLWRGDDQLRRELREAIKENPSRARSTLTELLAEILEASKTAGRESLALERKLKELTQPKVKWTALVRSLVKEGLGRRYRTWRRVNRRRIPYIPGSVEMGGRIWFLVDTSGSISDEELKEFASEIYAASRLAREIKIVVWEGGIVDVITTRNKYALLNVLKERLKGGGGTVVREALEYTYKRMRYGDVVVILSDGEWFDDESETERLLTLIRMKASASILVTTYNIPNSVRASKWKVIKVK